MRLQQRKPHAAASRAEVHLKINILRTLQTICVNLRQLQDDPAITKAYREVEDLLATEIAGTAANPGPKQRSRKG